MKPRTNSALSSLAQRASGLRSVRRIAALALTVAALIVGLQSLAGADSPERYPYDPVCPWGRLADGNGMMLRCLEPNEAKQLLQIPQGSGQSSAAPGRVSPSPTQTPTAPSANAPSAPSGAPERTRATVRVESVGPAIADAGDLPVAGKQLGSVSASEKYIQCVHGHGGLTTKRAKVVVRFLVRERGRAEGVGVKSHTGMSLAAAQCIAEVVNLRYVGYPAAPIVGATIPIVLSSEL